MSRQKLSKEGKEITKPRYHRKTLENKPVKPTKKVSVGKSTWIEIPVGLTPKEEEKRIKKWQEINSRPPIQKGFQKDLI